MTEVIRKAFYDASEREFKFGTFQDVEPILDDNHELRSQEQKSDMMRHTARIPLNVINTWIAEEADRGHLLKFGTPECDLFIYSKMQDPDNAKFRVDGPRFKVGFGS